MYRQRQQTRVPSRDVIRQRTGPRGGRPTGQALGMRLLIALVVGGFALFSYLGSSEFNPITGEEQYISISKEQEIALGLQSAPEMAKQFGGLDGDLQSQELIDEIGQRLVFNSVAQETDYPFEFHLLADPKTVNAFALPGGQIFITAALFDRLETEGQLAGVLAHEIGHVVARHGAQRLAQQQLSEGLTGAVVMATYNPDNPNSQTSAQVAAAVSNLVTMSYGRDDELESDSLGVRIMAESGYNPTSLIGVMEILASASGGAQQPEFFSTHPNPQNRIQEIEAAIDARFPEGVPSSYID